VSPILHFTEREVWDAIHQYGIPFCKLYAEGYRSLGARVTTRAADEIPAWEQDLENTSERGGRRQDKEGLMKKLRELGYM
jgi:phosphoadenosine phosphosulfate reductase